MSPYEWAPDEEAFVRYIDREIELARSNISSIVRSRGFSTTHDLLHSRATTFVAMQSLLADRPNRFVRDPRAFSSLPRERKATP